MKYNLLVEIISVLHDYETSSKPNQHNLKDFAKWLYTYTQEKSFNEPDKAVMPAEKGPMPLQGGEQAQISQLIVLMYKYVKFYLRKIFADTPLSSPDDFGFLGTLFVEGSLQKNELIVRNTMEFTSGVEIIKRLEAKKLIATEVDSKDKRAKRVALTPLGRVTFVELLPQMAKVGRLAIANLSQEQQSHLLELLKQLNHFHAPIFQNDRNSDIIAILERYIQN